MSETVSHGGCQCGGLRYELRGVARALYVCHCRECRKQSASAFGISVIVPGEAFRLTRGTPRYWSRVTDTGHTMACAFCPECGSRLWHQWGDPGGLISVKGGSLDEDVDLGSATHIWTSRKLLGVIIPEGCARFPQEPD